jgi:hypothetical protein
MRTIMYDGTDIPIRIGDRVCDSLDEAATGTLTELTDDEFVVDWDDDGEVTYDIKYISWIKPL